MNWSHGYNVSVGYTYGFYRELTPHWLNFSALLQGCQVPDLSGSFRYLELGCGQGFGLCLLAANDPHAEFLGVDFNPEHIAHARDLARAAGLNNVRFEEADFSELCSAWPSDYGHFDYAVLHGIYSWVPVALRSAIVGCLAAATHPGSLVYVSYNTLPGWTSALPLQHMLRRLQQGQLMRSGAQIIEQGHQLLDGLLKAGAAVGQAMPPLGARVETLKTANPNYLVQEYLHENWHPLWFSQVCEEMAGAKLSYVGSATLAENYLPGMLSAPLAQLVMQGEDKIMQQELIDLAINQSFRRDLYCRGARHTRASLARLAQFSVSLGVHAPVRDGLSVQTSFDRITIAAPVARALTEALAEQTLTIGEIAALPALADQSQAGLIQIIALMLQADYLKLAAPDPAPTAIASFNQAVAQRVFEDYAPYGCLAAAHSLTGVGAGDVDMLLYRCLSHQPWLADDAAAFAAQLLADLKAADRHLIRDGQAIKAVDEQQQRARALVDSFLHDVLPHWQRLGVFAKR